MRAICSLSIFMGLTLLLGCDEPPPSTSATSTPARSAPAPPPEGVTDTDGPREIENADPSNGHAEPSVGSDMADGYEREVVAVGADKRGRNYGGGVITEPIRQYFRAGQRINLLNLKRAMDLYKAANDNKLPTTHEQFMKEIVEGNAIELPQLPEGECYVFDPQRGELMVERPQRE